MAAPDAVDVRRLRRSAFGTGIGDGVVAVALPLLAAALTSDPLAVAGVVVAQHLPWAVLALALPVLQATDRRTLAGAGNSARAVAVAVGGLLAVLGNETILTIQLIAAVVGTAQALADDAERVGGESLTDAAGDNVHATLAGAGMAGVAIVGLPLGGILYELLAPVPLLLDVGVFAVAALFVLAVRRPLLAADAATGADPADTGLPHLAPGTGTIAAAAAVAAAGAGAVAGVIVLIALDDLGLGAPAFGLLLAGLAVSSLVGALVAPLVARTAGVKAGGAIALLLAAASQVAARSLLDPGLPYPAVLALGAAAAAGMTAGVLVRAQRHGAAPTSGTEALRAFHLAVWVATPLGAAVGGVLARRSGAADVLLLAAGGHVLSAVLTAVSRSPRTPSAETPAGPSKMP